MTPYLIVFYAYFITTLESSNKKLRDFAMILISTLFIYYIVWYAFLILLVKPIVLKILLYK